MKKLLNLILLVTTSLLLLSCEKDLYPGAYPYDNIAFYYNVKYIPIKYSTQIMITSGWNNELYPLELWVDNEEIATISKDGYLTGTKEGTVTVYARVMGKNGLLEKSNKYFIGEELTQYSNELIDKLISAGADIDNDNKITNKDLANLTTFKHAIKDDLLFKISDYLGELDSIDLEVYNQSLDLSNIKVKKLRINDGNYIDNFLDKTDFNENLKTKYLTNLILPPHLEQLEFERLPGIQNLDLRQYTSLVKISKLHDHFVTNKFYLDYKITPPTSIKSIEYHDCYVSFEDIYENLTTLRTSHPEDSNSKLMTTMVLSKEIMPNLKNITIDIGPYKLDISTYEAYDLEYIKCKYTDKVYISQSMYDSENYLKIGLQHYQVELK